MERSPSEIAAQLDEVLAAVRKLDERVTALERVGVAPRRAPAPPPKAAVAVEKALDTSQLTRIFTLGGRTLLVLAGAFMLRAMTESGKIPAWAGVGMGFLYAGIWIVMADRAGRAGQALSAGFHAISTVVIGFPLLFEATTRFHLLSPGWAAVVLTGLTGAALLVATRRRLPALAWVVSLGGMATAIALMTSSGRLVPGTVYLILLGVGTVWVGYVADWTAIRWPVAFVTDLLVLLVAIHAGDPASAEGPGMALLVEAALLTFYMGSFAARTLYMGRKVVPFEIIQTTALMVVGIGGAVWTGLRSGSGQMGFGVAASFFGVVSYAVAYAFVQRRQKLKENFYFYTTVGLVNLVAGTMMLLDEPLLSLSWGVLAIALAIISDQQRSGTLASHAVAYALGTGFASGVVVRGALALVWGSTVDWRPGGVAVMALVVIALTATLTGRVGRDQPASRVPKLALDLALVLSIAGMAVAWLAPIVAGGSASGAALATLRTVVLVIVTLGAAVLGRDPRFIETGWLAYPLLGITGLKMLLEDLPRGSPASMVLAFAFYGGALIFVPRLRSRKGREGASSPEGEAPAVALDTKKITGSPPDNASGN